MTASITSVEDLCNLALHSIGVTDRIGDIYEGSLYSKIFLDLYSQTRDELLRKYSWGFAERNLDMVLLKSAPQFGYLPSSPWTSAYPPIPWLYEYAYPGDCLKVRSIKALSLILPVFDPQPQVFSVINDSALSPPAKAICCNVANAILTYTGQVTDVTIWEPLFIETLVDSLGSKISMSLSRISQGQSETKKIEASEESADASMADINLG